MNSMNWRTIFPYYRRTGCADRIGGKPQVGDRDQFIASVNERQAVTHPGNDAGILK